MIRSMRWDGTRDNAEQIVTWVREQGGVAQWAPESGSDTDMTLDAWHPDAVRVRVSDGWAYAAAGDTVAMTDEWVPVSNESISMAGFQCRAFSVVGVAHE